MTPNEQEAAILLGLPESTYEPIQLAQEFVRQQYVRAVVTLGRHGALVLENEHAALFPALSVPAVDTTGAGDCFNAALAVCLAQGKTLFQAAECAINASAYSVQHNAALAVCLAQGKTLFQAAECAINASAYSVQHPGVLHALPTDQELDSQWHPITPSILF